MRKITLILLVLCLTIGLAACSAGNSEESAGAKNGSEEAAAEQTENTGTDDNGSDTETLVVYFSVTGNTKGVAEKIASITGADAYEIRAAQEYTDADIDYNDSESRATHEQNDPSARPEIGSEQISLDGYKTIYIGYPIWWGEEPRIMDTFVESYNFDGITMIPFCTSGSSGIGVSARNLESNAGSGKWLEGDRFESSISEDELKSWIEGLE